MLRYFFYLAWNWSLRLALFVIYHDLKGERRYGIRTVGVDDLSTSISTEQRKHASVYQPVNYYSAELLFEQLYLEDVSGALLDLGCGMGRVFAIAAAYDFKEIIGVDFSEKLCAIAHQTATDVLQTDEAVQIEIFCQDAASFPIPANVTTIFLFNPFDEVVMASVIERINESQRQYPRPLKILYANPVCKKLLEESGFIETFYFQKLTYLEGSVLEREEV